MDQRRIKTPEELLDKLSAYVDGELSGEDAADIDALIEASPDVAERVSTYRDLNLRLRAVYEIPAGPYKDIGWAHSIASTVGSRGERP